MKTILLIEDETVLGEMYKDKFSQAGLKVIWTKQAEDGLKIVKEKNIDLIVLDILLPRENGIFFLEKIKKESKMTSVPVIVFSNYDDPETKNQALALGVKEYLIKTNYTPKQIVDTIKQYL